MTVSTYLSTIPQEGNTALEIAKREFYINLEKGFPKKFYLLHTQHLRKGFHFDYLKSYFTSMFSILQSSFPVCVEEEDLVEGLVEAGKNRDDTFYMSSKPLCFPTE